MPPLPPDTLSFDGFMIGSTGANAHLGRGIQGFGHGQHRTFMTDRTAGGQAHGRSVRSALVLEVDAWAPATVLADLRARMDARMNAEDVLPLSWRGLGWPTAVELVAYVKPTAFDFNVDERILPRGVEPGVVEGLRCQWIAGDPHVYELEATPFEQASPASLVTWIYTNPGPITPKGRMGGRAWTVEVTAATTVHRPYLLCGSRRVSFRNVTMAPGDVLVVGPDRIPTVNGAPVVGSSGSPSRPDPAWPILDAGLERAFRIGCESGTFTATGEFRGVFG